MANSMDRCFCVRCSLTCFAVLFVGQSDQLVACFRHAGQAQYFHRHGRTGAIHTLPPVVEHGSDLSVVDPADDRSPRSQGALRNEDRSHRSPSGIQLGLDHMADGQLVRVGLQLQDFALQQDHLQKIVDADVLLGRYLYVYGIAAPFLGNQSQFRQLALDLVGLGIVFVDLVDRHDNGNPRCLGVVDRLYGLRHDPVVGGATTRTTMSVTWAPLARMAVKAS